MCCSLRNTLLGLFFFLFPLACYSYQSDTIQLASGEWDPYVTELKPGNGFITEIIKGTLETQLQITPKIKFMKWRGCEAHLRYGKVRAIYPYYRNKKRENHFAFSDPIADSNTVFFYIKDNIQSPPHNWQSLSDFTQYRMVIPNGYADEDKLRAANLQVSLAKDEETAFTELSAGKHDFLPLAELVGWNLLLKKFPDAKQRFATLKKPFNHAQLHLMFNKYDTRGLQLMEKFNKALSAFKTTEKYQEILTKYGIN
ncbi:substrate-binding periplasmic protein [Zooshikella ganghwensis]|uniref:substrate-binding periplasmic protein n=1 Tax=Zooshikella ganghwensis TaxID=202772 RepID=UPI0004110C1B|nr:transporter substrate-binding domain-containing protein [Zooshikella ganghwensis]